MAHSQMQEHIIFRWLCLKSTIEYLGEWEMLYNPDFNCTEFGTIKNAAGSNQWQETFEVTLVYNSLPHHASGGGVFYGVTQVSQVQLYEMLTKFAPHAIFFRILLSDKPL